MTAAVRNVLWGDLVPGDRHVGLIYPHCPRQRVHGAGVGVGGGGSRQNQRGTPGAGPGGRKLALKHNSLCQARELSDHSKYPYR